MIDFVKIEIRGINITELYKNPLLDFNKPLNLNSGEIIDYATASYRGLKFIIKKSKYVELQGSLHKYWNGGSHNANDFTFISLQNVIADIKKKFDLNLNTCILRNVEVGINIIPPITTKSLIRCVLLHRDKKFKEVSINKANYTRVIHNRFTVKAYDKKIQYPQLIKSDSLFRFEIKHTKMIDLNKKGIETLEDLSQIENLKLLSLILIDKWDEILVYDNSIESNNNLKLEYANWKNSNYWETLPKHERFRQKIKYNSEVTKNSIRLHRQLKNIMQDKVDFLLDFVTN